MFYHTGQQKQTPSQACNDQAQSATERRAMCSSLPSPPEIIAMDWSQMGVLYDPSLDFLHTCSYNGPLSQRQVQLQSPLPQEVGSARTLLFEKPFSCLPDNEFEHTALSRPHHDVLAPHLTNWEAATIPIPTSWSLPPTGWDSMSPTNHYTEMIADNNPYPLWAHASSSDRGVSVDIKEPPSPPTPSRATQPKEIRKTKPKDNTPRIPSPYRRKKMDEVHGKEKEDHYFLCPIDDCKKKFARKTDLERHNKSVHIKERNHECTYCGRLFARKDTLRRFV